MAEASDQAMGAGGHSRRDFLTILTASAGAIALGATVWPMIDALAPDAQSNATGQMIVNVAGIAENTGITVQWAGLPIYIRRLTAKQIAENRYLVQSTLLDPARFKNRVKPGYDNFVVVVGLNTGISCALEGNAPGEPRGPYDGWLSPCDGSAYDPLGRVRRCPARKNLVIPRFTFLNAAQIQFL